MCLKIQSIRTKDPKLLHVNTLKFHNILFFWIIKFFGIIQYVKTPTLT